MKIKGSYYKLGSWLPSNNSIYARPTNLPTLVKP